MRKHTPPAAGDSHPLPIPYRDQRHNELQSFNTFGIGQSSLRQLGVAALSAATLFSLQADPPGTIMREKPVSAPAVKADNQVRILLWNVAGRALANADTIQRLRTRSHVDAVLLQEVKHDDVKPLARRLQTAYVTYVQADPLQEWRSHGQGNAIISNMPPMAARSEVLRGTTKGQAIGGTVRGFLHDAAGFNTGLDAAKAGWQENRAVQSQTQASPTAYGHTITLQLANTHLAGSVYPEIHDRQIASAANYAGEIVSSGSPVIMCGDFNASQAEGRLRFAPQGFDSPYVPRPTTPSGKNPDQCHADGQGILGQGRAEVIQQGGSDHLPAVFSWRIRDPAQQVPVRADAGLAATEKAG